MTLDVQPSKQHVTFLDKGIPNCASVDPEIFFPERGTNGRDVVSAKLVCNACHYKVPCLEWALKHPERGIWGGTTERERRRMKRSRVGI